MDASVLRVLLAATVSSSVAILLIGALRKPLRAALGARVAYGLWLLVPALVLAALLPVPAQVLASTFDVLPVGVRSALSGVTAVADSVRGPTLPALIGLGIWAAGAVAMIVALTRRQRAFARSLGELSKDANGLRRSRAVPAPLLFGILRPQIVVPEDFESRYSAEERDLMLAHERAHLRRRDVAVNAVASAWLCLSWFNPLAYWALGRLRSDQELACDALVLQGRGQARRSYANALLKTQLAAQASWRLPIECRWQSNHPLKERIMMLKRPLPGMSRRLLGATLIVGLTVSCSYALWAGQAAVNDAQILIDISVSSADAQGQPNYFAKTRYLVRSGETPPHLGDDQARAIDFGCTAFLPGATDDSPAWKRMRSQGFALRAGQIFLECVILREGKKVSSPVLIIFDGQVATVVTDDSDGPGQYKIEIVATTSEERIAAARQAALK
jgi:beta-lactamase regulating signal transducer with metallopeptidase domain